MKARNAQQWAIILRACGVAANASRAWGEVFADEVKEGKFSKGDADIVDWLPEILHESLFLSRMEENLNYTTPQRLMQVWPSRFPDVISALPYLANPQGLANFVYGGRMGNTRHGDGWTYRGRSPIGITGLANYQRVGDLMGQDLVGIPDLLCQPRFALDACIAWWEDKIPDSMLGETTMIRKRVNGGSIGLAEVQRLTKLAKVALS